jgi:hypothetical protein
MARQQRDIAVTGGRYALITLRALGHFFERFASHDRR